MGFDRQGGAPVLFSASLAIFFMVHAAFIPACIGQGARPLELLPVPQPENQKVEDELVDEAVAEEKLWETRNR